jgi:hypothetical protein
MSSPLTLAIEDAIWAELSAKVHTCLPGVVDSYDPAGPKVNVKPLVEKRFLNGTYLPLPVIVDVPVQFLRSNRFHCSFPLARGDTGLILFAERSISEWLTNDGREVKPRDGRKFSLTDAIFIPGVFAFGRGAKIEDGSKFELAFDDAKIVSDGKTIEHNGATDAMVKEGPLNDILSTLIEDLQLYTAADFGAAFQAKFRTDAPTLLAKITQLASTKNKLG